MGSRLYCLLLPVILLAACGIEEIGSRPGTNREDIWTGPGINVGQDDKEVCYVTGFDYPDDYDWRTDSQKGSVKCSLVVFADGIPMMKVPVGDAYEVSSDPDMHRMLEGHLYTDYSSDSTTVIKKDGKTLFRYPAREMICGILADGEDIYTLGHSRSGKGFTYRKNGEVLIRHQTGRTFGRLHRDRDSICFAFSEPIVSGDRVIERYYHVRNGKITQEAVRDDVKKVWDLMSCNGEISYLATIVGVDSPVLFHNGSLVSLVMPEGANPLSFSMIPEGGCLCFEGLLKTGAASLNSAFWTSPDCFISFGKGMLAVSSCLSGDGICCAFNPSGAVSSGLVYRSGEEFPMPEGYAAMGNNCSVISGGILHIGLSSLKGERPVIWRDGEIEEMDIDGFIASVSIY